MDHNGSDDELNAIFGHDEEMGEVPQVEVPLAKRHRGKIVCTTIIKARSEGRKISVEFNQFGVAVREGSTHMTSRIGSLVRFHIPLSINDWRVVPNEFKDIICGEINESFQIPETVKDFVLKDAGIKWRQWKSSLTNNFIEKYKDKNLDFLAHPPKTWANCVKEADWVYFVASRLSSEWAAVRADKKRIRAQNKYDHRSGRGGYKKEEEKLRRELGQDPTQ